MDSTSCWHTAVGVSFVGLAASACFPDYGFDDFGGVDASGLDTQTIDHTPYVESGLDAVTVVDAPQSTPSDASIPVVIESTASFWLKADSISNNSKSSPVSNWTDGSSKHLDVSQSDTAQQPVFYPSDPGIRGLPYVHFTGSQCLLSSANAGVYTDLSVFGVFRYTMVLGVFSTLFGPSYNLAFALKFDGEGVELVVNGVGGSALRPLAVGTWYLFSSARQGTTNSAWSNGTALPTSQVPSDATTNLVMAVGCEGKNAYNLIGDLAEVIAFPSSLSTSDRESVECYLGSKYSLPLGHPCL